MRGRSLFIGAVAAAAVATPAWAQLPPIPTVQVPPVPTVQVPIPTVQVPVPTVQVPVPVPTVQVPIPVPTVVPEIPGVTTHDGGSGGGGSSGGGGGSSGGGSTGGRRRRSTGGGGSTSGGGAASAVAARAVAAASGGRSGGGSGGGGATRRRLGRWRDGRWLGGGATSGGRVGGGAATRRRCARRQGRGARWEPDAAAASSRAATDAASLRTATARCRSAKDRGKRRDCVLRTTVKTASRCLDDLSTPQRRVLKLRAGLGAAPRSRRGVARRLDITVRRVTRLERTGLSRLRTLTGQGACGAPVQTVAAANFAPPAPNTDAAIQPTGKGERTGGGTKARNRGDGAKPQGNGGTGGVDNPERRGGVAGVAQTNTRRRLRPHAAAAPADGGDRRGAGRPDAPPRGHAAARGRAAPGLDSVAALDHGRPELERPTTRGRPRERMVRCSRRRLHRRSTRSGLRPCAAPPPAGPEPSTTLKGV